MFAIFNTSVPQPRGGFCISVFLIVKRNSEILVGKISNPERWSKNWGLDLAHPERWRDRWQIPAAFLEIGDHPNQTAERILREQLERKEFKISEPKFFVSGGESSVRPGTIHNDLFFVYEMQYPDELVQPECFSELHFVKRPKLSELNFGRGHDEVLRLAGVM